MSESTRNAGGAQCNCCDGAHVHTPAALHNRRGLPSIAYRIGEYADFRESMVAGLSSSKYVAIGALRTREKDDYTIALLDAVACAADVLTFYQERIANESYLQTATERVSLQEMAKLIGYRLRPGVAAETRLAFALDRPTSTATTLPAEPGAFINITPKELTLGAGLKVQSVPGPDETPQIFETVEAITARPEWNAIRPRMSARTSPKPGDTDVYVQGVAHNLSIGDALAFVSPAFLDNPDANADWDFRLISGIKTEPSENRTRITWDSGLNCPEFTSAVETQVHVFRRRAAAFGHNAPEWRSMSLLFRNQYLTDLPTGIAVLANVRNEWPYLTMSTVPATDNGGAIDLDSVYSAVKPGSLIVLARHDNEEPAGSASNYVMDTSNMELAEVPGDSTPSISTQLFRVSHVRDVARAQFAMSGRVTRATIKGAGYQTHFFGAVRDTAVHVQSEQLTVAPYPIVRAITGVSLPLEVPGDGLQANRPIIVRGNRADDGTAVVHHATIGAAHSVVGGTDLTITPPLPVALERSSVVIHANVAAATHGDTGAQILGAGDASSRFQRFELKRLPLTYRSASNERGADSELTVRVGGIEWTEKPTLFDAKPNERAYTLETDEQGKNWIVFGDGVRGARLPTGVNNVRAHYRQGLGNDGNVRANQLTQLLTKPLGLKGVTNPDSAEGGTNPEPAMYARRTMPLGTRTLGRVVSLRDYEDFAIAFTGVGKAQAQVLHLASGPTIVVTIAASDGSPIATANPIWTNLFGALRGGGDPNVPFALLSFEPTTFRLGLKVKHDPAFDAATVLAAVEATLRTRFGFDARSLAQSVRHSEVIAAAHSVPGVMAVDVDVLRRNPGTIGDSGMVATRLIASRARVRQGVALPAELLLLDPAPLAQLEVMA